MKFEAKSVVLGFIIGTVGMTTVFATNTIRSATLSDAKVTFKGDTIHLNNSLVAIEKHNEEGARLYMPVREVLEYLGYTVEWNEEENSVDLTPHSGYAFQDAVSSSEYTFFSFDRPIVVNLKNFDVDPHIASLGFSLAIKNDTDNSLAMEIEKNEQLIIDIVTKALKNTEYESMFSGNFNDDFSASMVNEINLSLGKDIVKEFLITDLIMQ